MNAEINFREAFQALSIQSAQLVGTVQEENICKDVRIVEGRPKNSLYSAGYQNMRGEKERRETKQILAINLS